MLREGTPASPGFQTLLNEHCSYLYTYSLHTFVIIVHASVHTVHMLMNVNDHTMLFAHVYDSNTDVHVHAALQDA